VTDHLTPIQLAALRNQSASATETLELLEHAASCPACRELVVSKHQMTLEMASLRQVLTESPEHLSLDELTDFVGNRIAPAEAERIAAHLAECKMCSTDVAELRKFAIPAVESKQHQPSIAEWFRGFFMKPGMILSAAALLLVLAPAGWLTLHREPIPQNAQSGHTTPAIPGHDLTPQQKDGEHAQLTNPHPGTGNTSAGRSSLAFALVPGLVRGADSAKTLEVSDQIKTLTMSLTSRSELIAGCYAISITDSAEHRIWHGELTYKRSQPAIVVQVPADLLPSGRYVVTLTAIEDGGKSETLEEYALHIIRKGAA
jgi:hypothetical protein